MRYLIFLLLTLSSSLLALDPVEQRIALARKQVESNPKSAQAYNDLAFALCRKGRDTGDPALFDQALTALTHSGQGSGNLRVTALLGKHEYEQALKTAQEVNLKTRDDVEGWASLVDTNLALGNYTEAERCAQWILDLRPGSALGFQKAALLRENFGDTDGAVEFLDETMRRTSQNDTDQRAWLLLWRARLALLKDDPKTAARLLTEAQKLFPDSQLALGVETDIASANGDFKRAAELSAKRYGNVATTENLYLWAQALQRAGQTAEAADRFKLFETKACAAATKPWNANLSLIAYYDERQTNLPEALALAAKEAERRQDHATLDAYSWTLFLNGKAADAKTQMDKALAVGFRNPAYVCHAARIAGKACQ